MDWIAFGFFSTGTTAFDFSVTGVMADSGAGMIAFEPAGFFALPAVVLTGFFFSSSFFFAVAILTSFFECQVSGFKYQVDMFTDG
jgi:hypothetical protein